MDYRTLFGKRNQARRTKLENGPLKETLQLFFEYLLAKDYQPNYFRIYLRFLGGVSAFLLENKIPLKRFKAVQFETMMAGFEKTEENFHANSHCRIINHYRTFLVEKNLSPQLRRELAPLSEIELLLNAYIQYMEENRGTKVTTGVRYAGHTKRFLHFCEKKYRGLDLCKIRKKDIQEYILFASESNSQRGMKMIVCSLRSFLRYCYSTEKILCPLHKNVPTTAFWKTAEIPTGISSKNREALIESIDRNTSIGKRDYAVILLFARLGLRYSELKKLSIDDINWRKSEIIVSGKTSKERRFPISQEIGEALADYLKKSRPPSNHRGLFLRAVSPVVPLKGGIGDIVRRNIERIGLDCKSKGPHIFRYALARDTLDRGGSLRDVAEILGHNHTDTSMLYAKIDDKRLIEIARPWPDSMSTFEYLKEEVAFFQNKRNQA